MLSWIRIWTDQSEYVHYELTDENGTRVLHCAMPPAEWKALRDKQIRSYPGNVSISLLTDYIAVLADIVQDQL